MRVLVRRGSTLSFLPVLVAVQAFAVLQRGTPWLGEWRWTIDWAAGATILTAPLLAGCVAFELLRWRTGATWSLIRSTQRGGVATWRVAGSALAVVAALQVVSTAIMLLGTVAVGAEVEVDEGAVLALVAPLAVLAAAAAIGAAVVSCWQSLLAVPTAAALVFGVTAFAGDLHLPPVLRVGGTTGSLVGLTWDSRHLWASIGVLLSLTACLAAVVRMRDGSARTSVRRGAVVVTGTILAGSVVTAEAAPGHLLTRADEQVRYVCRTTEASTVCVASETRRQLPWLASEISRQSAPLRSIGIQLPRRYQQEVPYRSVPRGTAPIALGPEPNRPEGDAELIPDLLAVPAACAADSADVPPPPEVFVARGAIAAWIRVMNGTVDLADVGGEPFADWLTTSPDQQADWIGVTFEQLRQCRFDEVRVPEGVTVP